MQRYSRILGFAVLLSALLAALFVYVLWKGSTGLSGSLKEVGRGTAGAYRAGNFKIALETGGEGASQAVLMIVHASRPGNVLWQSLPGESFVAAARGEKQVRGSRAHFSIDDQIIERCPDQTIDRVEERSEEVLISGRLLCADGEAEYTLLFSPAAAERLRFRAEVEEPYNRIYLTYATRAEERFFGFGTQYTHLDMKGRRVPVSIGEQGVGRGAQPITLAADLQAGAGGEWHSSYASVPHYITSDLRSLFLENYEHAVFDLLDDHKVRVEVFSGRMTGQIVAGNTPAELIESYTEYAGRMRPLPDWILSGAVVGIQGGTERVHGISGELEALDTPVAAYWLQDWVGRRQTSFGSQLWWNWELDRDRYPAWERLVLELEERGARLLLYTNPLLADPSDKPNHRRDLFSEARERGYLVENRAGEPYMTRITDFSAAHVDLTNPEARGWLKDVLKEELIGNGASGWMADFGEGLPYDAALHSGEDPATYHNRYAEEWAALNREAIREAGMEDEAVFFTRSGYTKSPGESTLFWLGDQLVSWDRHDGMESSVTGLLSSGISGYSLNHSDIGGYTAIDSWLLRYHRSKELLMRWTELAAFTTVFRTHEGNRPELNHQFYSDGETLRHFDRFAKVYAAWKPYRKQLVREAAETGLPVVRHPFIHYPDDPEVYGFDRQFMVGREMMVAPVLDRGAEEVEVYLPAGEWVHLWSGREYGSRETGGYHEVAAPVGEPAVFYREGSSAGAQLSGELEKLGVR